MLNSGKKFRTSRDKKINILTLVLSEIFFLNESKYHNPPLQVKWSVPYEGRSPKYQMYLFIANKTSDKTR